MFETLEKLVDLDSCSDSSGSFLLLNGDYLLAVRLTLFTGFCFATCWIWRVAISEFVFYYRNGWNFNEDSELKIYTDAGEEINTSNYWKIPLIPLVVFVFSDSTISLAHGLLHRMLEICTGVAG